MNAACKIGQDAHFLVLAIVRHEHLNRVPDRLFSAVTEQGLRRQIPVCDAAIQGLANHGIG